MKIKFFWVLGLILLFASAASAATLPNLYNLGALTDTQSNYDPSHVVINPNGQTYVSDNFNRTLKVYDYKGNFVMSTGLMYPYGQAIDAAGNLYVGVATNTHGNFTGEVKVYGGNLNYLYSLGAGNGEFQFPVGIAVDADRVYVADAKTHRIKIYDINTHQMISSFGGSGLGAGYITAPIGIAVSPLNGDLYVVDKALYTYSDSTGEGASGQIFTRDGVYKSRFFYSSSNDSGSSAITAPGGVAIDKLGRVFVTDSIGGEIHIYDKDGVSLGVFDVAAVSGNRVSKGLNFGADGRLLVAQAGKLQILGLEDYTIMDVSPGLIDFDAVNCTAGTAEKYLTISNSGAGNLLWTITPDEDSSWIVPAALTGDINGNGSVNVGITLNTAGLENGVHLGKLRVFSPGAAVTVMVRATIYAPPVLSVDPQSLSLSVVGNTQSAPVSFNVDLNGDPADQSTWSATPAAAWIDMSPASGPSNATTRANVSVNTSGLEGLVSGVYTSEIVIAAACSGTAPLTVPVTLDYKQGGSITITSNIAEASYEIAGPESFTGGGISSTVNVSEGTYVITFNKVEGFKEPAVATKTVANGDNVTVSATYRDLRETNYIITSMGIGKRQTSEEVRVFGQDGEVLVSYGIPTPQGSKSGNSKTSRDGVATSAADIDGDGVADLVVGNMGRNQDEINALNGDGASLFEQNFLAFDDRKPVSIVTADFNADGKSEIVTAGIDGYVRVFGYEAGVHYDTGVLFLAAQTDKGVNLAVGDVDGDGAPELITALAGSGETSASATIWKVAIDSGQGSWSVTELGVISLGTTYAGTALATGDINADGIDEIIGATLPAQSSSTALVQVMTSGGSKLLQFDAASAGSLNVSISAGDLNFDGRAEIAVGSPASATNTSTVSIYTAEGALYGTFTAYEEKDINGAKVSIGKVAGQ